MRALVWIAVVLTLLLAGAFVADGVVRGRAEDRVAAQVREHVPGVEELPDVEIVGFPFLTQLAAGRLRTVHVTMATATAEGLRLEDVDATLTGVSTSEPYVAEHAEVTALVRTDAIVEVLLVDLELSVRGTELIAGATVLGLPLEIALEPRAAGQAVEVDVTGFLLGGARVDSTDLPGDFAEQLRGLVIPVVGLPAEVRLTRVTVVAEGLRLEAEGRDVALTRPR